LAASGARGNAERVGSIASVPLELVFFALTLVGVAVLHRHATVVAVTGLLITVVYKLAVAGFAEGAGWGGLAAHFGREWVGPANLFMLLVGFALMASQFERSNLPEIIPGLLPGGWTAGLILLGIVFALSAVLDNIAAAVIGAVMARHCYRGGVRVGFVAAVVAAANAGGAGSRRWRCCGRSRARGLRSWWSRCRRRASSSGDRRSTATLRPACGPTGRGWPSWP
jgi:hypothetical protein